MKLIELQEAKYHRHPIVQWIEDRRDEQFDLINIPNDERLRNTIQAITKHYGPPEYDTPEYVKWKIPFGNKVRSVTAYKEDQYVQGDPHIPYVIIEARYQGKRPTIDDFYVGDIFVVTRKNRQGVDHRFGKVTSIDHSNNAFTYEGAHSSYNHPVYGKVLPTGQGKLFLDTVDTGGPYGIKHVEVIIPARRKQIKEARYAGKYEWRDVYEQYRRLAADFAYNTDYSFIRDASARTASDFDDETGKHRIYIVLDAVINAENYDKRSAKRKMEYILRERGLPFSEITVEDWFHEPGGDIFLQVFYYE